MAVQKRKERCQVVHSASSTYSKAVQINSDCAPPPPMWLRSGKSPKYKFNQKQKTSNAHSVLSALRLHSESPLVVADLEKNTFSMDVVPELA